MTNQRQIFHLVFLILSTFSLANDIGYCQTSKPTKSATDSAGTRLTNIQGEWDQVVELLPEWGAYDHVRQVEVLYIDKNVTGEIDFSPASVEHIYSYKYAFDATTSTHTQTLDAAMKAVTISGLTNETVDYRWGIIFYGRDNKRIMALYLPEHGDVATINDTHVVLTGDFRRYLKSTYLSFFN